MVHRTDIFWNRGVTGSLNRTQKRWDDARHEHAHDVSLVNRTYNMEIMHRHVPTSFPSAARTARCAFFKRRYVFKGAVPMAGD